VRRILIVEDSRTQAEALAIVLEDAGYEVKVATDAERALAVLEKERFDALLTDVNLPGDSGFDLCRRVKADPRHPEMVVVIQTSQTDAANVLRGLEAGADNFMTKDRAAEEVVRRLGRAMERGASTDVHEATNVDFRGATYRITAGRERLLEILVSAFEDVVELSERHRAGEEALRAANGRLEAVLGEQMELQRQLREQNRRVQEADRMKSEFLANMSHEIRTPMNAILGMTALALETRLGAEQREYLTIVRSAGTALLALLNDILDLSKIEAGKLVLEQAEFDLRDVVFDTVKGLATTAHERRLELAAIVHPEVPAQVVGDSGRLRQVLTNLLGNAIKFTEKGEVVLEVELDRIEEGAATLRMSVRDTGIGIPADKHDRIFDAFSQADGSTTRKFGGTGLGLAITRQLVGMMGGGITLESAPGEGSTFRFTIRVGVVGAARGPEVVPRAHVLVLDNHEATRRMLEFALGDVGYRAITAGNVDAAVAVLERADAQGPRIAAALVDADLLEETEESARERFQRALRGVPAVGMLSGTQQGRDLRAVQELGAMSSFIKPPTPRDLREAVSPSVQVPVSGPAPIVAEVPENLEILLAEDNPVNQVLIVRLLEKRGHRVTIASTGRQVLDLLEEGRYDVVLMDVQMPEMDGFEATRELRARERRNGGHVPVIAMTAHAMKGDRERCLAAGMDAYVPKPVELRDLMIALASLLKEASREERGPAGGGERVVDLNATLGRMDGDRDLLSTLAGLFLEKMTAVMKTIEAAVGESDFRALERSAHSLRGSAANFSAQETIDAARRLEQMGRNHDLEGVQGALEELRVALGRLKPALEAVRK
jgi:signal transduction histidine kinase/HPt (histidine-containing phosphotransfer) domain-containing protein